MKKKLTHEQHLVAIGLFAMAVKNQSMADMFEKELNDRLGLDAGSHVSDAIYTRGDRGVDELNEALRREGFELPITGEGDK